MAPSPSLPLFADTAVALGPVPTEMVAARLTMEGRAVVGLQVTTPSGVAFYFLDPEQAKRVGEALLSVASGVIQLLRPVVDSSQLVGVINGHGGAGQ